MNGDVRLRVEGLMLERLIMRALNEGASFRRILRDGEHALVFETDPASAQILVKLCERFSLPCQVLGRYGWHALSLRLRNRITLLAGMLVCAVVVSLFLSRIWLIDIELTGENTETLRASELSGALEALGVYAGMEKSKIDSTLLERQLAASAEEFSFIGVRIQGVRLLVEASAAIPQPELYEIDYGRDLIAGSDGIVVSVTVQSGEACVKPGDTVRRGQVLIRGEERKTKEETRSIAALGTVVARTWYTGEASAPLERDKTYYTGKSSSSAELRLMDFAWPLLEGESYSSELRETEYLPIVGLYLPLEIQRTTARETRTEKESIDSDALRAALVRLAFADANIKLAERLTGDYEIVDQWTDFSTDNQQILHASAVYEVHTDIATTRSALLQGG